MTTAGEFIFNEELSDKIINGTLDLLTIADKEAKPLWCNAAWEQIFGLSSKANNFSAEKKQFL